MSRKARPEDTDEICDGLPETELGRDELAEVITDAWAAKAPKRLVREFFGE